MNKIRSAFFILAVIFPSLGFSANIISQNDVSILINNYDNSCFKGNGSIECLGKFSADNIGINDIPENITMPTIIDMGRYDACAIEDNELTCWGNFLLTTPSYENIQDVKLGAKHRCLLDSNGVNCWGDNSYTQTNVPLLNNPTQIDSGAYHSCAIDGQDVICWGQDNYLQNESRSLSNPYKLVSNRYDNCAFDDNGVTCWGRSGNKQLSTSYTKVSIGLKHVCALSGSDIQCWGDNSYNQADLSGLALSNPTDLAVGTYHSCAIDDSGIVCWGRNDKNQLSIPTNIINPTNIVAGGNDTCVLHNTNQLTCWGENENNRNILTDTDNDTFSDILDVFPNDSSEWADADNDGTGNNADAFPNDPSEQLDTDNDGTGDNSDVFPNDSSEQIDSDSDGTGDNADAFPTDPSEQLDSDGDGFGNNSDIFPNDPSEWIDTDRDGVGDNIDAFPTNWYEAYDTDGDGVGDRGDFFPMDPNEQFDNDKDGFGNNVDLYPEDIMRAYDFNGNKVDFLIEYYFTSKGQSILQDKVCSMFKKRNEEAFIAEKYIVSDPFFPYTGRIFEPSQIIDASKRCVLTFSKDFSLKVDIYIQVEDPNIENVFTETRMDMQCYLYNDQSFANPYNGYDQFIGYEVSIKADNSHNQWLCTDNMRYSIIVNDSGEKRIIESLKINPSYTLSDYINNSISWYSTYLLDREHESRFIHFQSFHGQYENNNFNFNWLKDNW